MRYESVAASGQLGPAKPGSGSHESISEYLILRKYYSSPVKVSLQTSDVSLKNKILAVSVGKDEGQSGVFLATRDFTCWRDREFNDKYSCRVSGLGDSGVKLNLDIVSIRFANAVAEDIARCIYDAVLVTVGTKAGFLPTPAKRTSKLERKFRNIAPGCWSYTADGSFNCRETEGEFAFYELLSTVDDMTGGVGVYTIDDGGIELVFDFMSYSFNMADAVWLANSLMEAVGSEPLDVLETTSVSRRSMAGLIQTDTDQETEATIFRPGPC